MLQLAVTGTYHAVIPLFIYSDLQLCWLLQQHCSTCYSYRSKTLYGDLIKRGCLGVILPLFGCSFHPYLGVFYPYLRVLTAFTIISDGRAVTQDVTAIQNIQTVISFLITFTLNKTILTTPATPLIDTCVVKVKKPYNMCNIDGIKR